jgi:hypothetical protein
VITSVRDNYTTLKEGAMMEEKKGSTIEMAELRSKVKIEFAVLTLQQIQKLKEMPLSSYSIEGGCGRFVRHPKQLIGSV